MPGKVQYSTETPRDAHRPRSELETGFRPSKVDLVSAGHHLSLDSHPRRLMLLFEGCGILSRVLDWTCAVFLCLVRDRFGHTNPG